MNYSFLQSTTCPKCHQRPTSRGGQFSCGCPDKQWEWVPGVPADAATRSLLEREGYQEASDVNGNTYYVNPARGPVVRLYEDGSWGIGGGADGRIREGTTLEDFLAENRQIIESAKLF